MGEPIRVAYASTKAAIAALRNTAVRFGKDGCGANVWRPAWS